MIVVIMVNYHRQLAQMNINPLSLSARLEVRSNSQKGLSRQSGLGDVNGKKDSKRMYDGIMETIDQRYLHMD